MIRQIERLKQPAREAGFQRVQCIAGSGLLDLAEQSLSKVLSLPQNQASMTLAPN